MAGLLLSVSVYPELRLSPTAGGLDDRENQGQTTVLMSWTPQCNRNSAPESRTGVRENQGQTTVLMSWTPQCNRNSAPESRTGVHLADQAL